MRRDRAEQRQGHDLYFLKPPKTGFARTQRRELRLRKAHRPSWRRPPHRGGAPAGPCPRGRLLVGRRAGPPTHRLTPRPRRRTGPSTRPCWPWRAPRAACSICAAAPFADGWAESASTSYPCRPCRSPCKIISFWSQRVFCTENQGVYTKALGLVFVASFRGGWAVSGGPGCGLGTRWDLPPPWWTHRPPRASGSPGGGIGKNPFCLPGLLGG